MVHRTIYVHQCGDSKVTVSFFMDIDLCVNGTLYHLRPPLRGLKHIFIWSYKSTECFRITFPLRERKNTAILYPESRYLCENSALHYFRPPMRGHQKIDSLLHKNRYPCVNGTPYHLRPTLRGRQNTTSLYLKSRYLCVIRLGIISYA